MKLNKLNNTPSFTTRAVNYAKAHPYKTLAAVVASVATLAFLSFAAQGAWTACVNSEASFLGRAGFRASEGFRAAASATKTAAAAVQSGVGATATAAQKAANWTADRFAGARSIRNAECLTLSSTARKETFIAANNCARDGFMATWFGSKVANSTNA